MFLNRIHIDPRCREARRDLSDPYQLHSTLCRAFSDKSTKCPEGEFLWRMEPDEDSLALPRVLVQSRTMPEWADIGVPGWLARADAGVDLKSRLGLDSLREGQRFRFRLRANPCVNRDGKRIGLFRGDEQEAWLVRKGQLHGFVLQRTVDFDLSESMPERVDVRLSQEQMMQGRQHSGNLIRVFSVLYDGILTVTAPEDFKQGLRSGIGHGKVMGLGLLSVVPVA